MSHPSRARARGEEDVGLAVEQHEHRHVRQATAALLQPQLHGDGHAAHRADLQVEDGEVGLGPSDRRHHLLARPADRDRGVRALERGPDLVEDPVGIGGDQVVRHAVTLPKPLRIARRPRPGTLRPARCVRALRPGAASGTPGGGVSAATVARRAENAAEDTIAAEKAAENVRNPRGIPGHRRRSPRAPGSGVLGRDCCATRPERGRGHDRGRERGGPHVDGPWRTWGSSPSSPSRSCRAAISAPARRTGASRSPPGRRGRGRRS